MSIGQAPVTEDRPTSENSPRWSAHPAAARAVRIVVAVVPIAASLLFVFVASRLVPAPSEMLIGYLAWWLGLCASSTVVLVLIDKAARRCLPLSTLLGLSLVFPDQAPSRFKIALRSGSVGRLRTVVEDAHAGKIGETPAEAAARVLELVSALNAHDRITRGHSERVRAYTKMIGDEVGLQPSAVDLLHWAGLLHDIGKLEVPYEILNKDGRPTEEEWEVLRRHPEIGARMVAPLSDWLGPWVLAVGQHHENWDGTGYPTGLAGADISLAARIVSVADVFDVITSARSYKAPIDAKHARAEIARCAGTQFDPEIVRAFLSISLGRLRFAMGPLSLFAQSALGGISIPPVIGAAMSGLALGVASLLGGVVSSPRADAATKPSGVTRPAAAVVAVPRTPEAGPEIGKDTPTTVVSNGSPTAAADDATIAEGASTSIPVLANDADPEDDALHLTSVAQPRVGAAAISGDLVRFTPPSTFIGTTRFSYRVADAAGASAHAFVTVHVRPVDRPPTANADSAIATESQTAILHPLDNDSDPDGDVVTATSIGLPDRGDARLVGDLLVYTPPPGYSGPDSVSYTVSDPSGASASALVSITVAPANDAPSFTAGPDQTVVEDAGAQVVNGWATNISPGPPDESGQTVTFTVTRGNLALFAAPPAVAADGTLTYMPAANASGSASFTIFARDSGDGTTTSPDQIFTITVVSVNDAPSFAAGPAQSVVEDAGPQVVSGWATSMSPGPGNESGQVVSFSVSNDKGPLFAVAPAVAADGTLSYTPAANMFGSATVTVRAVDDGGTANGGVDASTGQTFTITVVSVNDAPAFVVGSDQSVLEDAGAESVPGWATGVRTGPGNESAQTVSFSVSNDNGPLFAVAPAVAADGTLSYTPAANMFGSATVTVRAVDDGGIANGGVDTSAAQTFTITVAPVPPSPQDDAYTVNQDTTLNVPAPGLLANDSDDLGYPLTVQPAPVTGPTAGAVTLNADGSFVYTPNSGFIGTDTFTYRVDDGFGLTAAATASITVNSGVSAGVFYLGTNGSSASNYDLTLTPSPAATPVPDFDSDGQQGLTIEKSEGNDSISDPKKYHLWTYATSVPLALDGPVTLDLWSSITGFSIGQKGKVHVYLEDCAPGGTACVKLAQSVRYVSSWNLLPAWTEHTVVVGSVTRTIAPGRELRVRLLNEYEDLWVAMTAAYPSALDVTLANATPAANADTATVLEDAPTTNVSVLANDADANLAPTSVTITAPPTKGTATPRPDGTVDYTPNANLNGADSFTYRVCDTGGLCATATVSVTITPVNDAPQFLKGADSTTLEDAGPQSVTGWAPAISPGPANESGQFVSFSVTSDNPSLFGSQPSIAADGTLSFTTAADEFGSATVTMRLVDVGGTANGGVDTSAPQTFIVTVLPVNDAPSFGLAGASTTASGAAPVSIPGWANAIAVGPANEAGQTLSFSVSNDNPGLFSLAPAIAPDGTLTFTPNGSPGTVVVTVIVADDGGTVNGGVDTSSAQTFTIVLT